MWALISGAVDLRFLRLFSGWFKTFLFAAWFHTFSVLVWMSSVGRRECYESLCWEKYSKSVSMYTNPVGYISRRSGMYWTETLYNPLLLFLLLEKVITYTPLCWISEMLNRYVINQKVWQACRAQFSINYDLILHICRPQRGRSGDFPLLSGHMWSRSW